MSPETQALLLNLLPLVAIFAVAYFFMIKPQQKRTKEQQQLIRNLKRGDKVATIGGLQGTVKSVDNQFVTLIVNNKGTEMTFEKQAIKGLSNK
ncbi:preprotein translocase subunit YajC [Macrococcoides caseolyticum]|uniref:preprotein translocase subunit YajC n=1 Tax=Macrococcoides caseolyticum TaxID=69966 RepID=UPI000C1472E5|nr:preprotein translocase subunit YajC [Macrococcus caseolyticus]MBQ5151952.1 preprotein translocase subunit YajC [Macrococcus caseolyticus]MDJ1088188.1 preprotein translocase subunit YajC [Macrococcus caseolyticus]MDJ1090853.1 preprotein translocase subunit YajC [Macrococcus caseolyticus]MDJ1108726.1 preprotein translocase subunit YajC [Macrococcus caseolyticus]MDJ1152541.1 preprotein translocase subunit YajC [Macrococcus caseolyticus]